MKTIHLIMQNADLTERTFEEELKEIEDEVDLAIGSSTPEDLPDDEENEEGPVDKSP